MKFIYAVFRFKYYSLLMTFILFLYFYLLSLFIYFRNLKKIIFTLIWFITILYLPLDDIGYNKYSY